MLGTTTNGFAIIACAIAILCGCAKGKPTKKLHDKNFQTITNLSRSQTKQKEKAVAAKDKLFQSLLGELTKSMSEKGPANSISVCKTRAPEIAAAVSEVEDLQERGIGFRSLSEGAIDTTSASGELIFNIFSALAQFERRLIQERTKAGLAAARARGRTGGRPKTTPKDAKVLLAKSLNKDKSLELDDICKTLNISKSTFFRYVRL